MKMPIITLPKGLQAPVPTVASGPAWLGTKADQKKALKAAGQDKIDNYDIAMMAINIAMSEVHIPEFKASVIGNVLQGGIDGAKITEVRSEDETKKLTKPKRNPFFAENDAAPDQPSPVTQKYLTSRRWKKIGGGAVQVVGSLSSLIPHTLTVNVPGVLYHSHAAGLTLTHIAKIGMVAAKHHDEKIIQDFCKLIEAVKVTKFSMRGTQAVASAIPLMLVPTTITAAALKAGIKITMAGACYAAAALLHWKAYEEQGYFQELREIEHFTLPPITPAKPLTLAQKPLPPLPGQKPLPALPTAKELPALPTREMRAKGLNGPEAGPASALFWEIFTKRGATLAFGKYDIEALVREPAGWLALADKLMLI